MKEITFQMSKDLGLAKLTSRKMINLDQIVLLHKIQLFSTHSFPQFADNKRFSKKTALNVFEVQCNIQYLFL
jgi:hypothetical protein